MADQIFKRGASEKFQNEFYLMMDRFKESKDESEFNILVDVFKDSMLNRDK